MKQSLKRSFKIVAVFVMLTVCATLLFACGEAEPSPEGNYQLYIKQLIYSKATQTLTAEITTAAGDMSLDGATVYYSAKTESKNLFYNSLTASYLLESDNIYSAVENALAQDDINLGDIVYTRLKVEFVYDTIYKSVKSNGDVTKSGKTFTHNYTLDKTEASQTFTLLRETPQSANWYSILIAAALVLLVGCFGVYLAVEKRKKWRKN